MYRNGNDAIEVRTPQIAHLGDFNQDATHHFFRDLIGSLNSFARVAQGSEVQILPARSWLILG